MIVVSNTSPIINLAIVSQLDLLRQLYGKVIIPSAVHNEITRIGSTQALVKEVESLDWIVTQHVLQQTAIAPLQLELDEGEAEALGVLAYQMIP